MIIAALIAMLLLVTFAGLIVTATIYLYRASRRFRALRPLMFVSLAWQVLTLAMLMEPMTKMGIWIVSAAIVGSQGVEK